MDDRRRSRGGVRGPLGVSLLLHAAIVGFAVVAEGSAPGPPKTKVYAVDIVSPPPNMAGEPLAEPPATQEPGPAAAAEPTPAAAEPTPPAPEPTPPAPDPEPAPPRTEAPKEPAKAPEPRRTPEQPKQRPTPAPEQPKQRPATTPNRPTSSTTNANRPSSTTTNRPATDRPTSGTSGQSGTGSGPNRTQGTGTRTGPATGRDPDASSPGGEGLNIHVEGEPCPVAGYCENVTRQVNRFFRPPPESTGGRGEVCFRIQRDGSVSSIETRGVRGGAAFRLAMMEAAEAAGSRRSFGTLPAAFDPARWRWCVELSPR
jgi:outer membrane biosynthesis protein TonB